MRLEVYVRTESNKNRLPCYFQVTFIKQWICIMHNSMEVACRRNPQELQAPILEASYKDRFATDSVSLMCTNVGPCCYLYPPIIMPYTHDFSYY